MSQKKGSLESSLSQSRPVSKRAATRGTVLITHGRAKRRMIGFALDVGAAAARARIPELIADALA